MEKTLEQLKTNCLKVVLFGPESTGKTTLSRQLASHYKTIWVPEFARDYLQAKWDKENNICTYDDILPIAYGQIAFENLKAAKANHVLFCDTDLLETKVYSEVYFDGKCDKLLNEYALKNHYDLYLLTYIDIPWEKDDLRDKPNDREFMFNKFEEALINANKPFIILRGDQETRLKKAINQINNLLKK